MAAQQAPPSLGFSRQEHWSGLPFPSPMHESQSEVTQSCPTLSDHMDCSLSGSSIHGIFQARVLEWGAIAFSEWILYEGLNILMESKMDLGKYKFIEKVSIKLVYLIGEGNGTPLQYSCLANPMDGGA